MGRKNSRALTTRPLSLSTAETLVVCPDLFTKIKTNITDTWLIYYTKILKQKQRALRLVFPKFWDALRGWTQDSPRTEITWSIYSKKRQVVIFLNVKVGRLEDGKTRFHGDLLEENDGQSVPLAVYWWWNGSGRSLPDIHTWRSSCNPSRTTRITSIRLRKMPDSCERGDR